ncbi:Hsp20/alpha crystallin family protein [Labilibacter marinus]|uniref:Hsp20/alpha crystallin family protein n=1 Tax=Labilibacter marinus TaxID=1477105 RepID=UPI0008327FC2|nr:Hsp20/alpha crystallin family protein [Labilibacter marinus]
MTLAKLGNHWFPSFPSVFDRFLDNDLMDWNSSNYSSTQTTVPAVNVNENDDEFHIEVAAPGMEKKDFNVSYENGMLTISSEHKNEKEDKKWGKVSRKEFSYQSFRRSFSVAENTVNTDKISANYKNGILHISLPKREEVKPKPAKMIPIS